MTSPTALALAEVRTSTLPPTWTQRAVDGVTGWLSRRTSRRGFLVRAGLVGAALATDPFGYVLKPGTAYASVCGPGASCDSGWTVFCATINQGVNACPPGSIAAGWWKADGAPLCGGKARYIVDCNATCSRCTTPGSRAGICSSSCWSCTCGCGPSSGCDRRKVCCNAFRYGQCNTQVRQVGAVHCRVVSCTPPWKFANCSTSPATDNRTRDHNSGQLPGTWSTITARYHALGDNASALGATVYGERTVTGGRAQRYQRGRISYSTATGARETTGAVSARYVALGAEGGVLGFPVGYPLHTGADGAGRASRFQHGRISWSPVTGAFETRGPIARAYEAHAAEAGGLGYPTSGQRTSADGLGRFNTFQHGRVVLTAAGRAFTAGGGIGAKYVALGAEAGGLGYPTSDERAAAAGGARYTTFQRGRISWSSATGAHETHGGIGTKYVALGAEAGLLGPPTSDEKDTPGTSGGRCNTFVAGRVSWSSGTGAHESHGPLWREYVRRGAEASALGFPLTDVVPDGVGGARQDFQHGSLLADASGTVTDGPG